MLYFIMKEEAFSPDIINSDNFHSLSWITLEVAGDVVEAISWDNSATYYLRGQNYYWYKSVKLGETWYANLWEAPDGVIWTVTELLADVLRGNFHKWLYLQNLNNKKKIIIKDLIRAIIFD